MHYLCQQQRGECPRVLFVPKMCVCECLLQVHTDQMQNHVYLCDHCFIAPVSNVLTIFSHLDLM